jgi:hypothetical protein
LLLLKKQLNNKVEQSQKIKSKFLRKIKKIQRNIKTKDKSKLRKKKFKKRIKSSRSSKVECRQLLQLLMVLKNKNKNNNKSQPISKKTTITNKKNKILLQINITLNSTSFNKETSKIALLTIKS